MKSFTKIHALMKNALLGGFLCALATGSGAQERLVYSPGTEELARKEVRVISCGSGMPMPRLKQAAACFIMEFGNGEKLIFDMGTGSLERVYALNIPLDLIDKVFIGHLHMDHMGDLAGFYQYGPQNNRSKPLRVWGPGGGGTRDDWSFETSMEAMQQMWAWMSGTLAGTIDTSAFSLEVNQFDWTIENGIIYESDGIVVKTIPAIHFEQSVSFIVEYEGMTIAYSSDTLPNKYWIKHTKGVDLSIHEAFLPTDLMVKKWSFLPQEALNAGTTIHSSAEFFGKVMALTKPKHAVAFHFQNDHDTLPAMIDAIELYYTGPIDYAQDFMVWNVTPEGVNTRMALVNREGFPPKPIHEKKIETASGERYWTPEEVYSWFPEEFDEVAVGIFDKWNQANGTDFRFQLGPDPK
jgi:ribonuclease Z